SAALLYYGSRTPTLHAATASSAATAATTLAGHGHRNGIGRRPCAHDIRHRHQLLRLPAGTIRADGRFAGPQKRTLFLKNSQAFITTKIIPGHYSTSLENHEPRHRCCTSGSDGHNRLLIRLDNLSGNGSVR